ncbi:hypothetical protein OEZ85_007087 [Tetradesmus obliquus]|uniref:Uncharacterized protein n=1 Tax=Tetradesmus obliquus TaxID=3088 RepID=A0ABY8TWK9_TETOB|nr:hypothetical protein OEZ85_007087 [Tetradesmus obliquus]
MDARERERQVQRLAAACGDKQAKVDVLQQELRRLQQQLARQQRAADAALAAARAEALSSRESLAGDLEGATIAMQEATRKLVASEFLSLVPFKFPSPAAASQPTSPPAGPQQQPEAEGDAPATANTTADNSSPIRSKAGTKATRAAPTRSDDGHALQDTAAAPAASAADQPEATATAAVIITRHPASPKPAKPQAANTLPDSSQKQLEAEVVKTDWQQYEMLRACRLQNEKSDWYRSIYN